MPDPERTKPFVYLASQSPRRRELLRQIGVEFTTVAVEVDETPLPAETPEAFVQRLALDKARAARPLVPRDGLVLGADTAVIVGERILGKPVGREEALGMLAALSGATHRVVTGVALVGSDREAVRMSDTRVTFRGLTVTECERYWASGEPQDKAGSYAIQGLAAQFVTRIDGSHSGVVGLPLYETGELLSEFGIKLLEPPYSVVG